MRNFCTLIGILSTLIALTTNASSYFCTSDTMDSLFIRYDQNTQVPTSTYSLVKMGEQETQAPLDGTQRFAVVAAEANMLRSTIENGGTPIEIYFEDTDEFEKMICRAGRDTFGMPILAPRCEKQAFMITHNEMGMTAKMPFSCNYLAD